MKDAPPERDSQDRALLALLEAARAADYRFVTITPESHRRVLERRPGAIAADLRGVFGWSLSRRLRESVASGCRSGVIADDQDGAVRHSFPGGTVLRSPALSFPRT